MIDRRGVITGTIGATLAAAATTTVKAAPGSVPYSCIDVHSHFIPDVYRAAAVKNGHTQPDGMPALPAWNVDTALKTMDRLGITTAFLSISSPGVHFGKDQAACTLARLVNEEGAAAKAAHPDRFGHFASLPLPDVKGALTEIIHAFDTLNADGVILESNSGGLYPGDPVFEPIFAELDRRKAVVLLHPTSPHCPACKPPSVALPRPILEFMFETARAVTNLLLSGALTRYPNIRFIIPHAGATLPVLADRIAMATAILPDMGSLTPDKIFALLGRLYYDMAGAAVPRLLPALQSFADPSRLLYGSDWPFTPEPSVARLLGQLDTHLASNPSLLEDICRNNALLLFPRLREPAKDS
jgi:6-methylsalicylate decarboxylase